MSEDDGPIDPGQTSDISRKTMGRTALAGPRIGTFDAYDAEIVVVLSTRNSGLT